MRALLLRAAMAGHGLRYWRPLSRLADEPARAQAAALARIISANRETTFGAMHGFSAVRTPDDFRNRVPVQHYESLHEHIETQRVTGTPELTAEPPVFYARTSGSSGVPKHIPVTASSLRCHRAEQALFTFLQHRARPEAFRGSAWGIMGAAVEGYLDSGHAVGSVSGHLYESLPRTLQSRFVVPPAVASIEDYDTKYLVILRLALAVPDITYLGAPNPSTFIRLLGLLEQHRDVLARSLEKGGLDGLGPIAGTVHDSLRSRVGIAPRRAHALLTDKPLTVSTLWPNISLLTTWTGGSCGIALDALRPLLPRQCAVMELGYQATEMRGTLALEPETSGGLPPLHHTFFEFAEKDAWELSTPEYVGIERLEPGRHYYVVVTTAAGLYRYFMNDLVEVAGRYGSTPLLRFVQKGKGVTNLTGEKLYEGQVIDAVMAAARAHGLAPAFFQMVAEERTAGYTLHIEAEGNLDCDCLASAVDARLGELNIEYLSKRASARLAPLAVRRLRAGAGEACKSDCLRAGQREGQFKPPVLQYRRDVRWAMERYVID